VTEGTGHVIDPAGDARRTLQDAVTSHGPEVLSDATVMEHLCRTQLTALPGECILDRQRGPVRRARAAQGRESRSTETTAAIQSVATTLPRSSDLDGAASLWVVREFARALGLIAPGGTQSMPRPAPDGTGRRGDRGRCRGRGSGRGHGRAGRGRHGRGERLRQPACRAGA